MSLRSFGSTLIASAVVVGGLTLAAPAHAVGVPVMIDDFAGNRAGPRAVTLLPVPGASTTAPGTFDEQDGLAVMQMNGNGNGVGGVQLDYALSNVDLTSEGSNTQFFLEFGSIQRLPVQTFGETAASISIQVTDNNGVTGTYNTGISNIIGFNVVLNFACVNGPPCFSPQPNFTNVTAVSVQVRYPTNLDDVGELTAILDTVRATPTGGVVPSAPSPVVSAPSSTVYGELGDSVTVNVDFNSNTGPAAVTNNPPSDIGLRAQDIVTRGTAGGHEDVAVSGGPATYIVTVGPLTSVGTLGIDIPAEVVTDAWGQDNVASSGTPTVTFQIAVPPTLDATDPSPFVVGQPGSFQIESTGLPAPSFSSIGNPLPAGLTLDTDGTLSGTPAVGTAGSRTITVQATNVAGTDTEDYSLVVWIAPSVTSADSATMTAGTPGQFTVTYTGFPTPDLTVQNLPGWLSVNDDGVGAAVISGTPPAQAVGTNQLQVKAENAAGAAEQTFTLNVERVSTGVVASPSVNPAVYGQFATVDASIASAGAAPGAVQFGADGTDVGTPVVVVGGDATSPPLTAPGGGSLSVGPHEVTADFLPDDPGTVSPASDSFTLTVDKADTQAAVEVRNAVVATEVSAVAPGAGTPSGMVTIAVNGTDVGQAPLVDGTAEVAYAVPSGQSQDVSATYAGDDNFNGTSAAVTRVDPTIEATLTSRKPPTRFGWYGTPVVVRFSCEVGSAPLVTPCPDPVRVSKSEDDKVVERTILAVDGGSASVTEHLSVDLRDPRVGVTGVRDGATYVGHAPRAECVGTDALSGIATCRIERSVDGDTVRFRATATDRAGNSSVVRGRYRVLHFFVRGARYNDGAFNVHVGRRYTITAISEAQPRYYLAAPAPTTPYVRGPLMRAAGGDRWVMRVTVTPAMGARDLWNTGAKTGATMHVVRLRIVG